MYLDKQSQCVIFAFSEVLRFFHFVLFCSVFDTSRYIIKVSLVFFFGDNEISPFLRAIIFIIFLS